MTKTNKLQWLTIQSMNESGITTPLSLSVEDTMRRIGTFIGDKDNRQYTNGSVKYIDNGIVITLYETKS